MTFGHQYHLSLDQSQGQPLAGYGRLRGDVADPQKEWRPLGLVIHPAEYSGVPPTVVQTPNSTNDPRSDGAGTATVATSPCRKFRNAPLMQPAGGGEGDIPQPKI